MTRLEKTFKQNKKNKILVTYTVAGDPSLSTSKKILNDPNSFDELIKENDTMMKINLSAIIFVLFDYSPALVK